MTQRSSLRSGTQLGESDITAWPRCTIGGVEGSQAAIVVYDFTNTDTFVRAKNWVKELQRQVSSNIVIALAGNKADLTSKRAMEFQEAQAYADDNSLLFMETSTKTPMNVNEIFTTIAKKLPKIEPQNAAGAPGRNRCGSAGEQPSQPEPVLQQLSPLTYHCPHSSTRMT